MNFSLLKNEILSELLAGKSQREVSIKLGYSFDQVRRWENGTKELRWDEFCDLCEVLKAPLSEALRTVFQYPPGAEESNSHLFLIYYRKLFLLIPIKQLAEEMSVHHSVLKRIFSGDVQPSLEFVLALLYRQPMLLGAFLKHLLGNLTSGENLSSFSRDFQRAEFESNWPIASAIEGLLLTKDYLDQNFHDEEWFCKKLNIELTDYRHIWNRLVQEKQVVALGDGKFSMTYKTIETQGIRPEQVSKMSAFWTERAKQRFLAPDEIPLNVRGGPNVVAYRVVPMKNETARKATDLLIRAYQEILEMAKDDTGPADDVRVFLIHHFSVEDFHSNELSKNLDIQN